MPTLLLCCLLIVLLLTTFAYAEPVKQARTLTTDAMLAAWKADLGERQYLLGPGPYAYGIMGSGRRPVGAWADKSDEWLWSLMLPTTIQRVTSIGNDNWTPDKLGCPVHGGAIYTVNPFYPWIVDPELLPGKIKCPLGGETYPSNDFLHGDVTTGPYCDDGSGWAPPGGAADGRRYHFLGLYNHYAYNSGVVSGCFSMARLYSMTGDRAWAHKAAVLLLKVATEYPNATDRKQRTYIPGYGEGSGMVTDVVWSAYDLSSLAQAYDEIFPTIADDATLLALAQSKLPQLRTADDVRTYIEDNLFRSGMQALLDARIRPNIGAGQGAMAQVGLLMNDYGPKHPNTLDAMDWLYNSSDGHLKHIGNQFYKDGSSYESSSYNTMRQGIIDAAHLIARIRALAPERYDETRFPDVLKNEKVARFPDYTQAITAIGRSTICVGDVGDPSVMPEVKPRRGGKLRATEYLDGYGLTVLRDKTDECNATLFYGGVRGHAHYDPLFLGFYALGRDLLPNIGYPQSWNNAPAWEWSLLTHLTVVVDRDEAPCSTTIGSLDVLDAGPSVQVAEASKRPYRKQEPRGRTGPDVTDYRRMVALVDVAPPGATDAPADHYLLDVFRVTGGKDHLQSWHGPYTPRPVRVAGATLTPQGRGTLAGPDVGYGTHYKDATGKDRWDPYCHLKNVARGPMSALTSVTWNPVTNDPVHLRLNFLPQGETELIRADGSAPIAPDKNVLQWAFPHRQGADGLRSQFVTVVEPYTDHRFIRSLQSLPVTGEDRSGYSPIAVEVRLANGSDILLATGSPGGTAEGSLRGVPFRLVGRFGLIRLREGQPPELHLTEGSELSYGEQTLHPTARPAHGQIVAVKRGAREVIVEGQMPSAAALPGQRLIINNHGERLCSYQIVQAEALSGGRLRLVLDSDGNLGGGIATRFDDGIIYNGPNINMPFAGLVKMPNRELDYSDCFHYGGHLENGKPSTPRTL